MTEKQLTSIFVLCEQTKDLFKSKKFIFILISSFDR